MMTSLSVNLHITIDFFFSLNKGVSRRTFKVAACMMGKVFLYYMNWKLFYIWCFFYDVSYL